MEQGPDFYCWFDTTQFSYHCVHPIHAKMFSIQMLLHFSQIVQRVCTLVLFILFGLKTSLHVLGEHNGMKTEFNRTNTKSQGLVPAHFALIIIIVVHVVKHQSV